MKKNVIKMLLVAASVLALSGCGMAKAPTLDELKEGYASKPASNLEATVNLTAEGEFELTDVSDEVQELLDMLESQMDIDLNDGASAKLAIEMKLDGNNSEEASRMEGEMNVDFECSIDMIEDAFLEGIGDDDTISMVHISIRKKALSTILSRMVHGYHLIMMKTMMTMKRTSQMVLVSL